MGGGPPALASSPPPRPVCSAGKLRTWGGHRRPADPPWLCASVVPAPVRLREQKLRQDPVLFSRKHSRCHTHPAVVRPGRRGSGLGLDQMDPAHPTAGAPLQPHGRGPEREGPLTGGVPLHGALQKRREGQEHKAAAAPRPPGQCPCSRGQTAGLSLGPAPGQAGEGEGVGGPPSSPLVPPTHPHAGRQDEAAHRGLQLLCGGGGGRAAHPLGGLDGLDPDVELGGLFIVIIRVAGRAEAAAVFAWNRVKESPSAAGPGGGRPGSPGPLLAQAASLGNHRGGIPSSAPLP